MLCIFKATKPGINFVDIDVLPVLTKVQFTSDVECVSFSTECCLLCQIFLVLTGSILWIFWYIWKEFQHVFRKKLVNEISTIDPKLTRLLRKKIIAETPNATAIHESVAYIFWWEKAKKDLHFITNYSKHCCFNTSRVFEPFVIVLDTVCNLICNTRNSR